jgi:hypothetical protein
MVDNPTCIVLLSSNRNRVGSTGRCRCRCSCLTRASTWIGALVGIVTSFYISIALPFSQHWVLSTLGPLNILTSSSRSLEIVGGAESLGTMG